MASNLVFNPDPFDRDKIVFLHVLNQGQGDCIIIELPNSESEERTFILVDAHLNAELIINYLENFLQCPANDGRLPLVVITHPHFDHYGAIPPIIQNFKPRFLLISSIWNLIDRRYRNMLEEMCVNRWDSLGQINNFRSSRYMDFDLTAINDLSDAQLQLPESIKLEQVGPTPFMRSILASTLKIPKASNYNTYINNSSVVLYLTYSGKTILLPGDLQVKGKMDGWNDLLEDYSARHNGAPLMTNILKVTHHGSRVGTPPDILEKLQPEFAVVSCNAPKYYENPQTTVLPNQDTIENLRANTKFTFLTNGTGLDIFSYIFCIAPPSGNIAVFATQIVQGEVHLLTKEVPFSVDIVKMFS